MTRELVRTTAGKVLRSEDLIGDEKQAAATILLANPELGNPHVVRCDWCGQIKTLFRDEDGDPFQHTAHGWICGACNVRASSQEVKF